MTVLARRTSGILLHPTSLPGRYGIGDLGDQAYRFVDYLAGANQSLWQVLPLGPTSYGDSPYLCLSAFAGNTNLISLDKLAERGWLSRAELDAAPDFPQYVDYGWIIGYHNALLAKAYQGFQEFRTSAEQDAFEAWCHEKSFWLADFALFVSLKEIYDGKPWVEWPEHDSVYSQVSDITWQAHGAKIDEYCWRQWIFFEQWAALRAYANRKGIQIVGDIPIFVAHDSADVWARRELFFLDRRGYPPVVTGVPPDSFEPEKGQRWGHPVYLWGAHIETDFEWWVKRVEATLELVDVMRIDHFRGFYDYFEVPGSDLDTTKYGRWMDGPKDALFNTLAPALKERIIAEDLGDKMEDVIAWRESLGLPGMKILQFAFAGTAAEQEERFGPDSIEANSVVYTGTHDNNTSLGWWRDDADEWQQDSMKKALTSLQTRWDTDHPAEPPLECPDIFLESGNWSMIQLGMLSGANTLIIPMQDILGLGSEARMNRPGGVANNWAWRYGLQDLRSEEAACLSAITRRYDRGRP